MGERRGRRINGIDGREGLRVGKTGKEEKVKGKGEGIV
jgi:hypothetical protein